MTFCSDEYMTPLEKAPTRVLHVIVGHGLRTYFLNTVRSVRAAAPTDQLLIIDNASRDERLRSALQGLADENDKVKVVLRDNNDLALNRKVGSLYSAYTIAFEYAAAQQFDLIHLLQGDFQMMWWDEEVVAKAVELFDTHPSCVNIMMQFLSRDKLLADTLAWTRGGLLKLSGYGLTDTGLYHLTRWQSTGLSFASTEQGHGRRYLHEGLEVICHPWPTDAPIPWPAVVRDGVQRGKEMPATKPYLLKPLTSEVVSRLKQMPPGEVWLEDMCIPWGWICATPMWVTDLNSIDYWVLRYRDARKNGVRHLFPSWESRGVDPVGRRRRLHVHRYRPSLLRLFLGVPAQELLRRLRLLLSRLRSA